jgi:hypothetical protein
VVQTGTRCHNDLVSRHAVIYVKEFSGEKLPAQNPSLSKPMICPHDFEDIQSKPLGNIGIMHGMAVIFSKSGKSGRVEKQCGIS